jgi:hypothetical protein
MRSVEPDTVGQSFSEKARHMLIERAAELTGFHGVVKDLDGRLKVPEKVFKATAVKPWP